MKTITNVLKDSGSDFANIIKCNVYLKDMKDFAAMNEAYLEFFPDVKSVPVSNPPPSTERTCEGRKTMKPC